MTLLPTMKLRLAAPSRLIDLVDLPELKGISVNSRRVTVGAMTSHRDVASSAGVRAVTPVLSMLARGIGDPQVRNRGTIGGSVANNDPAADYPAAVLALDARVRTSEREIGADAFFTGLFETALSDEELLLDVSFPIPRRAAYAKFRTPGSRYALVGVLVADTGEGVRVAVTGAGPCVYREKQLEAALDDTFQAGALEAIEVSADGLNADMHGSAEYRAHLVNVMARRAVARALADGA